TDVDHLVQRLAKHLLVLIDLVAVLLLIPELGLLQLQLVLQRPDLIHLTTERSLLALVPGLVVLDLKLLTPQFELSERLTELILQPGVHTRQTLIRPVSELLGQRTGTIHDTVGGLVQTVRQTLTGERTDLMEHPRRRLLLQLSLRRRRSGASKIRGSGLHLRDLRPDTGRHTLTDVLTRREPSRIQPGRRRLDLPFPGRHLGDHVRTGLLRALTDSVPSLLSRRPDLPERSRSLRSNL